MKTNIERCEDFIRDIKTDSTDLDSFIQRFLVLYEEIKDTTVVEEQKALFRAVYVIFRKTIESIDGLACTQENKELFREANRRHDLYKMSLVDIANRWRHLDLNEEMRKCFES